MRTTGSDFTLRVVQNRDYEVALTDGTWAPDPDNLRLRFGSAGSYQFMGYSSPDLDAALREGAQAQALTERARAYARAQQVLARDLPLAPLVEFVQVVAVRSGITGLPQLEARGLVTFNDYSLVRIVR